MGQIRGFFRSDFSAFGARPIWPTLEPNLPSLLAWTLQLWMPRLTFLFVLLRLMFPTPRMPVFSNAMGDDHTRWTFCSMNDHRTSAKRTPTSILPEQRDVSVTRPAPGWTTATRCAAAGDTTLSRWRDLRGATVSSTGAVMSSVRRVPSQNGSLCVNNTPWRHITDVKNTSWRHMTFK